MGSVYDLCWSSVKGEFQPMPSLGALYWYRDAYILYWQSASHVDTAIPELSTVNQTLHQLNMLSQ